MAFAELGDFIDSPLRTYSSGMAARLGFAVATAWEAELLLVDELLAVGDEAFQEKCLDRIDALRRRKVALLLVSHDLAVVSRTCDRAVWLDRGTVGAVGAAAEVVARYRLMPVTT